MSIYINSYINQILSIALPNKYTKWYCQIVNRARQRAITRKDANKLCGYVEEHHILPKSFKLGGEKDNENFAFLTAREHFIVHWLLPKMLSGEVKAKMVHALSGMCRIKSNLQRYTTGITAQVYAKARFKAAILMSIEMTGKVSPLKGRISPKKGRKCGPNLLLRGRTSPNKGNKFGPHTILKMKVPKTKVTCPHCGKIGGQGNMKRYHFDMCLLSGKNLARPPSIKGINGKKITVEGITYESIYQAANMYNMTRYKFLKWYNVIK